ncbi:MAG TPA: hypothetical protein VMU33_17255 [Burkholderiaceae bacterium]|nr:hypothetical protein [Burkholderiaceae bacterium]
MPYSLVGPRGSPLRHGTSGRRGVAAALLSLGLVATALPARSDAPPDPAIPDALRPWIGWVLRDAPEAQCPRVDGDGERACVLASSLAATLQRAEARTGGKAEQGEDSSGGHFEIDATAYRDAAVLALPGQQGAWPVDVRVDGAAAPVVAHGDVPQLLLARGHHHVSGELRWIRMPAQLRVPENYARLDVTLDGRPVRPDASGALWLARPSQASVEQDAVSTRVFRRFADEIPSTVETAVELTVAGRPREIVVPGALLPGFTALRLQGSWPMRIDGDLLRVQAVAGRNWVRVTARQALPLSKPTLPAGAAGDEVWSFAAVEQNRRVDVRGPVAVDPKQADVPDDWQSLPAWRVKPGQGLEITERHRGEPAQAQGRLALTRILWLDEDGRGMSFRDHLDGEFAAPPAPEGHEGAWRLEMPAPYRLGRAAINGQDQVLTHLPAQDGAGLEIRSVQVGIDADGRVESGVTSLPVAGWSTGLQSARATLNLPPAWRLLHASGVTHAEGSWTSAWTLWDLFLALLICATAGRVLGAKAAAVVGTALALSWTAPGAPGWWWLVPLVAAAVARATSSNPASWFARAAVLARRAGIAILALWIVAFSYGQVRDALHPVLEEQGGALQAMEAGEAPDEEKKADRSLPSPPAAPATAARMAAPRAKSADGRSSVNAPPPAGGFGAEREAASSAQFYEAVDPAAKVQTGAGVPTWRWRSYALQWAGPVTAQQSMRLWLVPPWLVRVGHVATVALLLLALWFVAGRPGRPPATFTRSAAATAAGVVAAILVGASLASASPDAAARDAAPPGRAAPRPAPAPAVPAPDSALEPAAADGSAAASSSGLQLLHQLRERLLAPPPCAPNCAAVQQLLLEARGDRVEMTVVVNAQADVVAPVPGGAAWRGSVIEIDGRPAEAVQLARGRVGVHLAAGVHRVARRLAVDGIHEVAIDAPGVQGLIESHLDGWRLSGLRDDGGVGGTLNLVRVAPTRASDASGGATVDAGVEPYAHVARTLSFGAQGQKWQVVTDVARADSGSRPQEVRVALLEGESVTTPSITVADGEAVLTLPPGGRGHFVSDLAPKSPVRLKAAPWPGQSETWTVRASPSWDVQSAGLPPVQRVGGGAWNPQWRPWPGESLQLLVTRPEGVEGRTLTIDRVQLHAMPGSGATDVQADIALRASLGSVFRLELPQGAIPVSVQKDGVALPVYLEGRSLPVQVEPGAHRLQVAWREARGEELIYHAPRLDLGGPAVNAAIRLTLGRDRWLLLALGPTIGPVVLFWSLLIVLVAVALVAARLVPSPLSASTWVVLALGAGQSGLEPAAMVLVFLAATSARQRFGARLAGWRFNLAQVAYAVLCIVAVSVLFESVHNGLLGRPSMLVTGNGSTDDDLHWYLDRVEGATPDAVAVSVPIWCWRVLMLLWSVWLALRVVDLAKWSWQAFSDGRRWDATPRAPRPPRPPRAARGARQATESADPSPAGSAPEAGAPPAVS